MGWQEFFVNGFVKEKNLGFREFALADGPRTLPRGRKRQAGFVKRTNTAKFR
jgi:hypothetical protein